MKSIIRPISVSGAYYLARTDYVPQVLSKSCLEGGGKGGGEGGGEGLLETLSERCVVFLVVIVALASCSTVGFASLAGTDGTAAAGAGGAAAASASWHSVRGILEHSTSTIWPRREPGISTLRATCSRIRRGP